jgi:hypothetical protein
VIDCTAKRHRLGGDIASSTEDGELGAGLLPDSRSERASGQRRQQDYSRGKKERSGREGDKLTGSQSSCFPTHRAFREDP